MKIAKRIICILITISLTCAMLWGMTGLLEKPDSRYKYTSFFNEKEDFDVLFFGSSRMLNGVFPMELWNNYGIVSYNMGGHACQIATSYWIMKNALEYTTPKLVVVDCFGIESNWKRADVSHLHMSFDAFPISGNKVKAVCDLLDDPFIEEDINNGVVEVGTEEASIEGLLWDYSVYHSRWDEIDSACFDRSKTIEKGAESRISVWQDDYELMGVDDAKPIESTATQYLEKLISECKANNIEVLLTYLPTEADVSEQQNANYLYEFAKQNDVNYINFLNENVVNYKTDFYDSLGHLNPSGARKVTNYIGDFIKDNYSIADHRGEVGFEKWDNDYSDYRDKLRDITVSADTVNMLMLLSGVKEKAVITINDKSVIDNDVVNDLLANLGLDSKDYSKETNYIIMDSYSNKILATNEISTLDIEKLGNPVCSSEENKEICLTIYE